MHDEGEAESGHLRLKRALVLRDALAADLGIPLDSAIVQLRAVEESVGSLAGVEEAKYFDALSSICAGDIGHLSVINDEVTSACARSLFVPRYAQYLALVMFAQWCHRKNDEEQFVRTLNYWLERTERAETLSPFTASDLQLAAFWMATAAGKTHILHACLAILEKRGDWDRIVVITPSEALTRQHAERLRQLLTWEVFAYPMDGDSASLGYLSPRAIIILDINKLTTTKKGDGLSIPTSAFRDSRNLVFVDEGHKGQRSEISTWKALQADIAGIGEPEIRSRGLLIEFSATFGQVAEFEHAFERYAKSIVFDYAYDRFHQDGYGKDFWFARFQATGDGSAAAESNTMTAALLAFWHQVVSYRTIARKEVVPGLKVAKPLWVLLGLSVIGGSGTGDKEQTSDVIVFLRFISNIIARPSELAAHIKTVLHAESRGIAILPPTVRSALKSAGADVHRQVLRDCFGWDRGDKFVLRLIDTADGELGLGLIRGDRSRYFGVVNVGDVLGLKKSLMASGLTVENDALSGSLFTSLDAPDSDLNVLVGSRRFAEGWDNFRASSLTLLRLGQREGSLIIQMFGRVVRFAGVNGDGRRLRRPPPAVVPLQTAYVFALKSDYLETFLTSLSNNGVRASERIECDVRSHIVPGLASVRASAPEIGQFLVTLEDSNWPARVNKTRISLSTTVATAALSEGRVRPRRARFAEDITKEFTKWVSLVDQNAIYYEMLAYRRVKGWWNFSFRPESIAVAIHSNRFEIVGVPGALDDPSRDGIARLNRVAVLIVRRMFEAAYRKEESRMSRYALAVASDGIPKKYYKDVLRGQ